MFSYENALVWTLPKMQYDLVHASACVEIIELMWRGSCLNNAMVFCGKYDKNRDKRLTFLVINGLGELVLSHKIL